MAIIFNFIETSSELRFFNLLVILLIYVQIDFRNIEKLYRDKIEGCFTPYKDILSGII
tara:strand:- start:80 stop:253 length:174 start_codon:yes stop_codon:yes gene_type:complete